MASPTDPDYGLSPAAYGESNASFYRAEPADYFEQRWLNLALAAGNSHLTR